MNTTPPSLDNFFTAARTELEATPDIVPTQDELESLLVRGRNLQRLREAQMRTDSHAFAAVRTDRAQRLNQVLNQMWRVLPIRYAVGVSICALCGVLVLWNTTQHQQSIQHPPEHALLPNNNSISLKASIDKSSGVIQANTPHSRSNAPLYKFSYKKRDNRAVAQENIAPLRTEEKSNYPESPIDEGLQDIFNSADNTTSANLRNGRESFERVFNVQTTIEPNAQAVSRTTLSKQMCAYCPPLKHDITRLGLPESFADEETNFPAGMMPVSVFRF